MNTVRPQDKFNSNKKRGFLILLKANNSFIQTNNHLKNIIPNDSSMDKSVTLGNAPSSLCSTTSKTKQGFKIQGNKLV